MSQYKNKALDTHYDGYKFRSRTEARWAVFFNELNITYQYEPEGFKFDDGECYLPDFYLPTIAARSTDEEGMWVEVKGQAAPLHELDGIETAAKLTELTGDSVAVVCGPVANGDVHQPAECGHFETGPTDDGRAYYDNYMRWLKCHASDCGAIKYEFNESNYYNCEQCGSRCSNEHPDINQAVKRARKARFEHGDRP